MCDMWKSKEGKGMRDSQMQEGRKAKGGMQEENKEQTKKS